MQTTIEKTNTKKMENYFSLRKAVFLILINFILGTSYATNEWLMYGKIEDALFIGILSGATTILNIGLFFVLSYLSSKGIDFYNFVFSSSNPEKVYHQYKKLCSTIINRKNMLFSGLIYGLIVGSTPFVFEIWSQNLELQFIMSAFLFSCNFTTGIAFYSLVMFIKESFKMSNIIEIELWQIQNPSTNFIIGISKRISLLASVYIGLCLTSIFFSKFELGILIAFYSLFCGIILLITFILPISPLIKKIRQGKEKTLNELDCKLQTIFKKTMDEFSDSNDKVDLTRLHSLLEVREKVASINPYPFKVGLITTGISILLISSFPVFLELGLKVLLK